MARDVASPWSDWQSLQLHSLLWRKLAFGVDVMGPLMCAGAAGGPTGVTAGTCDGYDTITGHTIDGATDPLDCLADQLTADYSGGAMPKPAWTRAVAKSAQWFGSIAIPDYVVCKQPGRFSDWSGTLGDGYPDPTTEGGTGGRRVALQIRNIIISRAADFVDGPALGSFFASAKFRGYGGCPDTASGVGDEVDAHQDSPVAGDTVLNGSTLGGTLAGHTYDPSEDTAFGDMEIPSNPLVADSQNPDAPIFDGTSDDPNENGVCRIDTIIEIPDTVAIGDVIELTCGITIPANTTAPDVCWYSVQYRWIVGPFPFAPNSSIQLLSQTDATSGKDQLESQSRDDDQPYNP
jgi:hypothetical protein